MSCNNIVINGDFDSLSGWTTSPDSWGSALCGAKYTGSTGTSGFLYQSGVLTENCYYNVSFNVAISSEISPIGLVTYSLGSNTGTTLTSSGTINETLLCTGNTDFSIYAYLGNSSTQICVSKLCVEYAGCPCSISNYCISNTGYDFDGNYTISANSYNSHSLYHNSDETYFIYFSSSENQWCLSNSIGGTCLLSGKSPCTSLCPDLCEDYLFDTICPTPTPTPTFNCSSFDFEGLFDCLLTMTPTPTMTLTPTPTLTTTPTPTSVCQLIDIDAEINSTTSTPTPTPMLTPTPTPTIVRNCDFSGTVTFNVINAKLDCPYSQQFQDCNNGIYYYTNQNLTYPGGGSLLQYMVFQAVVDGQIRCISYIGNNADISGGNNIQLLGSSYGYSIAGACSLCPVPVTSTPTPTLTSTPTPTRTLPPTPTPTSSSPIIIFTTQTPTQTPTLTSTPTLTPTKPGPYFAKFTSFGVEETPNIWPVGYVYSNIFTLKSAPNDVLTIQLDNRYTLVLSGDTLINSIPYPQNSVSTFNVVMDSFGNGSFTLDLTLTQPLPAGNIGYRDILMSIISSSLGSQISTYEKSAKYSITVDGGSGGPNPIILIGSSSVTSSTSAIACNNFSIEKLYSLCTTSISIGSRIFTGAYHCSSPLNGNNKWLSFVRSPALYSDGTLKTPKYAAQIDSNGYIINLIVCP